MVVCKNEVTGVIRVGSFLFMLCDMIEVALVNIKYQNM